MGNGVGTGCAEGAVGVCQKRAAVGDGVSALLVGEGYHARGQRLIA